MAFIYKYPRSLYQGKKLIRMEGVDKDVIDKVAEEIDESLNNKNNESDSKTEIESKKDIKTKVVKAKSELYDFLKVNSGLIILNSDDPKQVTQVGTYSNTYTFSEISKTTVNVKPTSTHPFLSVTLKETVIKTHLVGIYNFHNIAAALAIGTYYKLTPLQLKIGIESYIPANNRSQLIQQNSNEILLDAYNANPSSMEVALENFKGIQSSQKLAILGDMFELGTTSTKEHLEVVNQAVSTSDCSFYFVGTHFYEQNKVHPNLLFFKTFEDLQLRNWHDRRSTGRQGGCRHLGVRARWPRSHRDWQSHRR